MKQKELNKTLAEIEEEKYLHRYSSTYKIRISKTVAILMLAGVVGFALCAAFDGSFLFSKVHAEDGAGTYWTCSNCGSSNKCYEMSCSSCGSWR